MIEVFFDGYCPECLFNQQRTAMRLNSDDFWECPTCRLQATAFPPQAAILRWRGNGDFRQTISLANDVCTGLVMHGASRLRKQEIFPDESGVIMDGVELRDYLREIHPTYEAYEKAQFDYHAPALKEQERKLEDTSLDVWQSLFSVYDEAVHESKLNSRLHQAVYQSGLIFPFEWSEWEDGREHFRVKGSYEGCTLLELSMYFTLLFRGDRFNEGLLDDEWKKGRLQELFSALYRRVAGR